MRAERADVAEEVSTCNAPDVPEVSNFCKASAWSIEVGDRRDRMVEWWHCNNLGSALGEDHGTTIAF